MYERAFDEEEREINGNLAKKTFVNVFDMYLFLNDQDVQRPTIFQMIGRNEDLEGPCTTKKLDKDRDGRYLTNKLNPLLPRF